MAFTEHDYDITLVVPTIREESFKKFCQQWGEIGLFRWVHLLVVEDNPKRSFDVENIVHKYPNRGVSHVSWEEIDADLERDSWIIPRRSDTVRSYGYLKAWRDGCEFVMTLDDDCYPLAGEEGVTYKDGGELVRGHLSALLGRTRWFNTLNEVKPRGIPFYNLGQSTAPVVNHGLWTNVLDYDAPYQLANPVEEKFSWDNRIVPNGSYFPMCGMNVMWRSEATVLMYHLLMGQMWSTTSMGADQRQEDRLRRLPFDRFGDIWCGIIMKRICDELRLQVSSGTPYIRHDRASNPFANLKKEANGIEVNERFWEHVDRFRPDNPEGYAYETGWADQQSLIDIYREMGEHVSRFVDYPEHIEYFHTLGNAMVKWADVFKRIWKDEDREL